MDKSLDPHFSGPFQKKVLLPRDWRKYEYTAQCIPSDVCAVDVVGATKGLKGDWEVFGGWALRNRSVVS